MRPRPYVPESDHLSEASALFEAATKRFPSPSPELDLAEGLRLLAEGLKSLRREIDRIR